MQYTAILHYCKNDNFRIKNSNVYPRSMFKNNEYPCKPQFYNIKVGCKGSTLDMHVNMMAIFIQVL